MSDYGYEPMTEFIKLETPVKNMFGWYVMTEETTTDDLYFLATDTHVRVRDKTTGFFFKTELEAHKASITYYTRFGEIYPYVLVAVGLAVKKHNDAFESESSESKVMEFE